MPTGAKLVTRYRLRWLLLLTMFLMLVLWLFFYFAETYVPLSQVRSEVVDSNPPPQTWEELAGPLKVKAEDLIVTLSSSDGALHLRFWAEEVEKDGANLTIKEGAVRFIMENRDVLELHIENASVVLAGGTKITGTIRGHIIASGQFFSATELIWKQSSSIVHATSVSYRTANFEVYGNSMELDLSTGEASFSGGVDVGL